MLAGPSAGRADTVVAKLNADTPIAASDGAVAYSAKLGDGSYALRLVGKGQALKPKIARRDAPFDVDLGRSAGGRPNAVFSRCTRTTCTLYRYDMAERREHKLGVDPPAGARDQQPRISKGRILFVRSARLEAGPDGTSSTLMTTDLHGTVPATVWQAPTGEVIRDADLRGNVIAVTTLRSAAAGDPTQGFVSTLYTMSLTSPVPRVVATVPSTTSLLRNLIRPQLLSNGLLWADNDAPFGTSSSPVIQWLHGNGLRGSLRLDTPLGSLAATDTSLYYSTSSASCGAASAQTPCTLRQRPLPSALRRAAT